MAITWDAFEEPPHDEERSHRDSPEGACTPETGCSDCWPHPLGPCADASCRVCEPTD